MGFHRLLLVLAILVPCLPPAVAAAGEADPPAFELRNYDDSECRLYGASDRTVAFVADGSDVPELIVARDVPSASINLIPVNEGWSWISFNLLRQDMSVDGVLSDLNPEGGDIIKSQQSFSQFDPDFGWVGTVKTFDNRFGYLRRGDHPAGLRSSFRPHPRG